MSSGSLMSHWLSRICSVLWSPRMPPTLEFLRESSVDWCHRGLWCIETQAVPGNTDAAMNQAEKQAVLAASRPRSWYLEACWALWESSYVKGCWVFSCSRRVQVPSPSRWRPKAEHQNVLQIGAMFYLFQDSLESNDAAGIWPPPGQINQFGGS